MRRTRYVVMKYEGSKEVYFMDVKYTTSNPDMAMIFDSYSEADDFLDDIDEVQRREKKNDHLTIVKRITEEL